VRALKSHGGVEKDLLKEENIPAMLKGCGNLFRHLDNIRNVWKTPVVVTINRFTGDTDAEVEALKAEIAKHNVPCEVCEGWGKGGEGARELASAVAKAVDGKAAPVPSFTYADEDKLTDKIRAVAQRIYGAKDVTFSAQALRQLKMMEDEGYGKCPVCIAKTQYSFSDDPKKRNAPENFEVTIRSARLSAGAGFVVAFAGDIIAMPGLPKRPAAEGIDVDENGVISGLF